MTEREREGGAGGNGDEAAPKPKRGRPRSRPRGGPDDATIVKKYANRRLYDTGASCYVTLEDLAAMVRGGRDFVVQDAKTGEDITRPVLGQIIFEQEAKEGQSLLPTEFLRQVISYYGDQMGAVVPSYLEQSMAAFARGQEEMKEQMARMMGGQALDPAAMMKAATEGMTGGMAAAPLKMIEEQTRRNAEMFAQAMRAFSPFGGTGSRSSDASPGSAKAERDDDELAELKAQIAAMQRKVDGLGR